MCSTVGRGVPIGHLRAERLPVSRLTVEQAYTRYVTRLIRAWVPTTWPWSSTTRSSTSATATGRTPSHPTVPTTTRTGGPAHAHRPPRLPRAPRDRAPRRCGGVTLDLVGRDPVLVVGPDGAPWADAADRLGVLIAVLRLGTEVEDPHGEFAKAYGIGPDGAVLIRPTASWRGAAGTASTRPARTRRSAARSPDARPSLTRLGVGRVTLLNTRCLPGVPA